MSDVDPLWQLHRQMVRDYFAALDELDRLEMEASVPVIPWEHWVAGGGWLDDFSPDPEPTILKLRERVAALRLAVLPPKDGS